MYNWLEGLEDGEGCQTGRVAMDGVMVNRKKETEDCDVAMREWTDGWLWNMRREYSE